MSADQSPQPFPAEHSPGKKVASSFFKNDLHGAHIHFTGIKGTGMAALVEICAYRGARISGSDVAERFYTDEVLERLGIKPTLFAAAHISADIDVLIYSSAYSPDTNPELIAARKAGIPMLLYTEALGLVSETAYSCGIAGVHGKTTTTGMCGLLLKALDLPAQVLAGSVIPAFGGCTLNMGRRFFVAETCEYRRHFMSFRPRKIILTSVESDHQDYYPTYESIRDAFVDYCLLLPHNGELIYCADDKGAEEVVRIVQSKRADICLTPYGVNASGDYRIVFGNTGEGVQHFSLAAFDTDFCVSVPGKHIVLNGAAACALAVSLYAEFLGEVLSERNKALIAEKLQAGLSRFGGAKRRSETVARCKAANGKDILIVDDYAHHPTAIKTTIAGFRSFYPGYRIIVDFMSHTYTRTAALLDDFASSFSDADEIILHKIYASAREHYDGSVSGKDLYEKVRARHDNVHYFEEVEDALSFALERLSEPSSPVLFMTMGAGDNWKLGKLIAEKLNA